MIDVDDYYEDIAAVVEHNMDVEGEMQWYEFDLEYGFSEEVV